MWGADLVKPNAGKGFGVFYVQAQTRPCRQMPKSVKLSVIHVGRSDRGTPCGQSDYERPQRRNYDNKIRPHSLPRYSTPAPETILP